MSNELPTSVWSGSFMLGDLEMRCHVLSNGQRIIEAECLEELFERPIDFTHEQISEFVRWFRTAEGNVSQGLGEGE